jgi:hypothetical protein
MPSNIYGSSSNDGLLKTSGPFKILTTSITIQYSLLPKHVLIKNTFKEGEVIIYKSSNSDKKEDSKD